MSDFKRYMLMEDNQDGTVSISLHLDENTEIKALATFDFEDLVNGTVPEDIRTAVDSNQDRFMIIPDSVDAL